MKLLSTTKAGLGGLVLSASLVLFSSGAAAVEIEICALAPGDATCIVDPLLTASSGGGWEFEFADGKYLQSTEIGIGNLRLTLEFLDGLDFDPILTQTPMVELTDPSNIVISPTLLAFVSSSVLGPSEYQFEWSILDTAVQIHDFHITCHADDALACDGDAIAVSALFSVSEGEFQVGMAQVAVPAPATLSLIGLALLAMVAGCRRRSVESALPA